MRIVPICMLLCFAQGVVLADDWARWLGPTGDAVYHEKGVVQSIPKGGLKTLWEAPVNLGYSGPSVADGKVFFMDYIQSSGEITNKASWSDELNGQERVVCLDAATGEERWSFAYDRPYRMSYPGGPRATPIYSDGKVYALGAEGNFHVLDAETGKLVWSKDFKREYSAETPRWGHAAHPLIYKDMVICIVGGIGSVAVAFDKKTGEQRWRKLSADSQGYCPPSIIHYAGVDQLIIWHPEGMNSLNPMTGQSYWFQDLRPKLGLTVSAPRFNQGRVFASGQGGPAALLQLSGTSPEAELVWLGTPQTAMYTLNNTPFFTNDAIYGVDLESSSLIAVDPSDGSRIWMTQEPVLDPEVIANAKRRIRHGTAFLYRLGESDIFYIVSENGDLVIAELSVKGYREIGRQNLIEPTNFNGGRKVVWSPPAFANRTIYLRNDKKLVAIDLSEKTYKY